MSESLPEQIRKSFREQLGNNPNPSEAQIREAIEKSAPIGVQNNPRYVNDATQSAMQYYERGVPPEDAAVAGAVAGRNTMMKDKPSLPELGEKFSETSDNRPGLPPWGNTGDKIENFNEEQNLGLSSESRGLLGNVADNSNIDGATPGAADMAVAAAANVASGGTATPSGLEIFEELKVKVHGAVTFNLDNIHIKTVQGVATYTHESDVNILAPSSTVKLKGDTVSINATETETNDVDGWKKSFRGLSIMLGPSTYATRTSAVQTQVTGASLSFYGAQAHLGTIKIGGAIHQDTLGITRAGITMFNLTKMNKWEKTISGMLVFGPVIFFMFL